MSFVRDFNQKLWVEIPDKSCWFTSTCDTSLTTICFVYEQAPVTRFHVDSHTSKVRVGKGSWNKSLPLSYWLAWLSPFFWVQLPPVPSATTYRESFKTPEFKLLKMRSVGITRTKRRLTNLSKTPFSNNLKKQEVTWLCPVKNKWWKKLHFLGALVNFISFLAGYNLNIQQDISAEVRSSKNFEECKSLTYFWLYESPRSILLRSLAFVPKTITFDIKNHFIFAT